MLNQSLERVASDQAGSENFAADADNADPQAYHKESIQPASSAPMKHTYSVPAISTDNTASTTTQRMQAIPSTPTSSPTSSIDSDSRHTLGTAQKQKPTIAKVAFWSLVFGATTVTSAIVGAVIAFVIPLSSTALSGNPSAPDMQDHPSSIVSLWRSGFKYYVSRPVTILVMGTDAVLDGNPSTQNVFSGRSDTMLLVHLDPQTKVVNLLSIPRDTRVELEAINPADLPPTLPPDVVSAGAMKINRANAIGGPALSAKVVSTTLGGVKIDRYVRVSTDAFRELVDLLGGIDVYVPYPMKYDDFTQKLHIDLAQGWQTLNGEQAEQFARFRHDAYGDVGRVQRQQFLMTALKKRLTSPTVVPKIPQILNVMSKYIDTNLTLEEMLALANFGLSLDQTNFKMVLLPGRFSQPEEYTESYWIMDPEARDRVLSQYFNVKTGTATEQATQLRDLRIAVQNASNQPHLGREIVDYLQARGFRNVYLIEDWPDPQRQSQIVVQRGDQQAADALRQMLGFGQLQLDSTGDLESDLTIRVGNDVKPAS
ncbi:MAG: LCP family protein [Cyanobacteria bacterium]|nr:LCP family protein [Cyanobacteriota bacterium]MDW8200701.1 LCP family protein [Cyanobacteriota bacterium SKYGB_h_bin112]